VLCADPPVQSTRRFVIRRASIAGVAMNPEDSILIMLAAAGRDPALNQAPDSFDLSGQSPPTLDFGTGIHACPAQRRAPLIARVAVAQVLAAGVDLASLERPRGYRRSNHLRVPIF
jgi:cytochrome P450